MKIIGSTRAPFRATFEETRANFHLSIEPRSERINSASSESTPETRTNWRNRPCRLRKCPKNRTRAAPWWPNAARIAGPCHRCEVEGIKGYMIGLPEPTLLHRNIAVDLEHRVRSCRYLIDICKRGSCLRLPLCAIQKGPLKKICVYATSALLRPSNDRGCFNAFT